MIMLLNKLKSKSGNMSVWALGFLLLFFILLSAVTEYNQAYTIAASTEEMVRKATVTMAVNNTYDTYGGSRDTRGNIFTAGISGNWTDIASTTDLNYQLCKLYQFKQVGGKLVRNASDEVNFSLDIKSIACANSLSGDQLRFTVVYRLEIPLRFMREIRLTVPIDNTVQATFKQKY